MDDKSTEKWNAPFIYLIVGIVLTILAHYSEEAFISNHFELFENERNLEIQHKNYYNADIDINIYPFPYSWSNNADVNFSAYPFTFETDIVMPFEEGTVNKLKNLFDYVFKYLPNEISYALGHETKDEKLVNDLVIHERGKWDISKIQPEVLKYSELNERTFIYHFIRFFSESIMFGLLFGVVSFIWGEMKMTNFVGWTILGCFVIFFLFFAFLSKYDPFKVHQAEAEKKTADSIAMWASIDSIRIADKRSEVLKSAAYNHLNNGVSPFDNCFGHAIYDGHTSLTVENSTTSDAIFLLYDVNSDRTILNKYIRSDSSFPLIGVRQGSYKIKVLFGNNWNSQIASPCVSNGFFETDIGYDETENPILFKDNGQYQYQLLVAFNNSIDSNTLGMLIPGGLVHHKRISKSEFFKK